ncbi:hypothetical protein CAAN1_27S00804 [[Candida] anglica]|uniref:Uncharacterized protein n=1 Tax=[Candida] anglica TaxID=148631 RepID=A0ABP0E7T3_9ASCO
MKQDQTNSTALQGSITNAPLDINDRISRKLIKSATVYIYTSFRNDSKNLLITGLIQEGTFQVELNENQRAEVRRKVGADQEKGAGIVVSAGPGAVANSYTDSEWEMILRDLFRGKLVDVEIGSIYLSARYLSSEEFYSQGELIEEVEGDDMYRTSLYIDIKTGGKLPITLGTIELTKVKEEEMYEKPEMSLLNWLDLLIEDNKSMNNERVEKKKELEKVVKERDYYKKEVIKSSEEHLEIMKDIERKFYHVLNSKKDRIWEVEKMIEEKKETNSIEGINEKFVEENHFNLNRKNIDLKDIPQEFRGEIKKKEKGKSIGKRRRTDGNSDNGKEKKKRRGKVTEKEENSDKSEDSEAVDKSNNGEDDGMESTDIEDSEDENEIKKEVDEDASVVGHISHEESIGERISKERQQPEQESIIKVKREPTINSISDQDILKSVNEIEQVDQIDTEYDSNESTSSPSVVSDSLE